MELDVYSDLDILDNQFDKIEEENAQLKESVKKLEIIAKNFTIEIRELKKINKNLEVNISSLYKTAKAEIERKDRLISELREELDTVLFKRGEKTNKNDSVNVDIQENELLNKQYAEAQSALDRKSRIIISLNKELNTVRRELLDKSSSSKRTFSHIDKDSELNYSEVKKQKIHEKEKIVEHEDEYNSYCNRNKRDSYIRSRSRSPNFRKFDVKRRSNLESQVELKRIEYTQSRPIPREQFRPNNKFKYNRFKYVKNSYKDRYENVHFSKSHSNSPAWNNYKHGEKQNAVGRPETPDYYNKNNKKNQEFERNEDSGIYNSQSTENTGRFENPGDLCLDSLSTVSVKSEDLEDGELDSTKFEDIDFDLADDKESIENKTEINQSKEIEVCTKNISNKSTKLTDSGIKTEFINNEVIKTEDDSKNIDLSNISQKQSIKEEITKGGFPKTEIEKVKNKKIETADTKLHVPEKNLDKICTDEKLTIVENSKNVEKSNKTLKKEQVKTLDKKISESEKPTMEKKNNKLKNDKTKNAEKKFVIPKKSKNLETSNNSIKNDKKEIVDRKLSISENPLIVEKTDKVETVAVTEKSPDMKNSENNDVTVESNLNKQKSKKNNTNIAFVIDAVCKETEIEKTTAEPETNISFVSESPRTKKSKNVHTVSDQSDTNVTLVTEAKTVVNNEETTKTVKSKGENVKLKRPGYKRKDNTETEVLKESANFEKRFEKVEKSKDIPILTTEPSTSSNVTNVNLNKDTETSVAPEGTINVPSKTENINTTDKQLPESNLQPTAKKPIRLRRRCVISIT